MSEALVKSGEIQQAFKEYDRQVILNNIYIGCLIGVVLMPLGSLLDYFIYHDQAIFFLKLRLLCSLLIGLFWLVVKTPYGSRHPREYGVLLAIFPAFFISVMVYETSGASSSYYAGLNLVLLVVGFVLHWTFVESLIVVSIVIAMYVSACFLHGKISAVDLLSNAYFLSLTGVIVVTGSYFHSKTRYREFAFRYQLDKSKQQLEETNRKLIELDQLKSRFFANVSHELRTPLTLLLAPLEALIKRNEGKLDGATQGLLETMHNNGLRLLKLINDLLELIRLEAGRLEIKAEPLPVAEFINGLASAVRQMALEKRIVLEVQTSTEVGVVLADRDKLEKILLNLLFNALKFTPASGRVWLHAKKQDDDFLLIVGDTGMGIAETSLPFVFDRFWQEDGSSKRKFQGVGIGLALVKELTETMNGSVTVQSQLAKGTVFTVKLPFKKGEVIAPLPGIAGTPLAPAHSEEWLSGLYRRAELFPVAATQNAEAHNPTFTRRTQRPLVLVADDEPDMRGFLVSQLVDDYELIEAVDGQDATDKAQTALPDVILLDLMMPRKDGLQVCRELRDFAPTANIPIILLTARADEEAKFDALQMGANDFLAKPFSSTELQARIKNLIESHHAQRKLTKQNVALSEAIEQIKETEMQLVQSEKLSSLGRMSAGIIHEINNPLNYSMTGLFTLRNKGKKLLPEDRVEYDAVLDDIEEGLKRVRNIVSDLRTFTHPGGGTGEPVEAGDAADAAVRFLGGEWKDTVEIHQDIPPSQNLWANRNKLIHVLVNLMQNAIDALREKPFADGEKPEIWIQGRLEADRSLIIIRDNGPGIDPKIMDKIFDPFFTTKEVGKGMGLGLSICYRIVQSYGGKISARSERGKYCEFTLDFPADADASVEMEIENGAQSLRL